MGRRWSSKPSTSCFPGRAICSPIAAITAAICVMPARCFLSGESRSSNGPRMLPAFNCCHGDGLSNELSLGSIETAAWQRISRRRSRAPKRGSTSPLCSSSSGDWPARYTMYLRYNTTIPIKIQTLREADLRMSDLSSVNLREANLFSADLREANLRDANLAGASLVRANFHQSTLTEANLTGARLYKTN